MNRGLVPMIMMSAGFRGEEPDGRAYSLNDGVPLAFSDQEDPFALLAQEEETLKPGEVLAGFLTYEAARWSEPGLDLPRNDEALPQAFGVRCKIGQRCDLPACAVPDSAPFFSDPCGEAPEDYQRKVRLIRERIAAGDFFQVNLSQRLSASVLEKGEGAAALSPPEALFRTRFGAFIDLPSVSVLSASPELFLERKGETLSAEPIKGTRPRGEDPASDLRLLEELVRDPKDRAENMMIVDLLRNDLAKVCADHTIREPTLCGARTLTHVHHLYSRIEGSLRGGLRFGDAMRAAFPCGSVTGAPKRAAMRAIAELEGEARGAYCGALFWIEQGYASASVAIRTASFDKAAGRLDLRSGGGVTILSDPEAEYRETLDKAYLFSLLTKS